MVMGLEPGSTWSGLDPELLGVNQVLGTTGMGLASGSSGAGSVLEQARSLGSQEPAWRLG